jgi:hypothetical protein
MESLSSEERDALSFLSTRQIDNVYLDTTFADPSFEWFPTRVWVRRGGNIYCF